MENKLKKGLGRGLSSLNFAEEFLKQENIMESAA